MSISKGNISTLLDVQELSLFDVKNMVLHLPLIAFEVMKDYFEALKKNIVCMCER